MRPKDQQEELGIIGLSTPRVLCAIKEFENDSISGSNKGYNIEYPQSSPAKLKTEKAPQIPQSSSESIRRGNCN